MTYRGFTADGALHHMLMEFAIQSDKRLAYSTINDRHSPCIWTGNGCVGWR